MGIKNILEEYSKAGDNLKVSKKELSDFAKEYLYIRKLRDKYNSGHCNRKEVGEEILERVKNLNRLIDYFKLDLSGHKELYEFPEYISDYTSVLVALITIANKKEEKYVLKEFPLEQQGSYETRHGDRERGIFKGNVWVIGDKEALSRIDNSKPMSPNIFKHEITKVINEGYSTVMITSHDYDWSVLPDDDKVEKASTAKFKASGFVSELCAYTHSDELAEAVYKLSAYIDTYGGNISGIGIDDFIDRVNSMEKGKTLSKTGR